MAKKADEAKADHERVIDAVRKKYGDVAATTVSEEHAAVAQIDEYISTGVDVLDNYVITRGGLPVGRLSEVYGENAAGKTSLAHSALAACQRRGGTSVLIDTEFAFEEERATTLGVDLDRLVILQPDSMEDLFAQVHIALNAHDEIEGPMLIAWDSLASIGTKDSMGGDIGDRTPGREAALLSRELKKLPKLLTAKRAHLMMLNQTRMKFGVRFGDNTTTPGGNAPKFYASVRLAFFGGKGLKNAKDEHVGKVVTISAMKNRLAAPFRKARVRFDFATGWNNAWSTIEHAKRMGLVTAREKGFKGAAKSGRAAYEEALGRLGWKPSAPIRDDVDVDELREEGSVGSDE